MPSLIVSLLAQRPTEELEAVRDKARAEMARLEVELQQVEEALARQSRRTPRLPAKGAPRPGNTRKRILEIAARSKEPVSPAQIMAVLREEGDAPSGIYNILARLVKGQDLVKVDSGQYTLASRNGAAKEPQRFSENGTTEPLSRATGSHSEA